jgi:hypothetical protein
MGQILLFVPRSACVCVCACVLQDRVSRLVKICQLLYVGMIEGIVHVVDATRFCHTGEQARSFDMLIGIAKGSRFCGDMWGVQHCRVLASAHWDHQKIPTSHMRDCHTCAVEQTDGCFFFNYFYY